MRLASLLPRFARDRHGGITQLFALAIPAVITLAVGAVDLASVNADRLLVQDTADSAALAAAKQLTLSDSRGVVERAQAFTAAKLVKIGDRLHYTVDARAAEDGGSVTVTITGTRTSFFANMLPPGGWKINSTATATIMGQTPLCLLSTGKAKSDNLAMDDSAKVTAPGCLVHANSDITLKKQSMLTAHVVQAAGTATGMVSPKAQVGAPEIDDPFADMNFSVPASEPCKILAPLLLDGLLPVKLPKGRYCSTITVAKKQTLELEEGIYYFSKGAKLELLEDSVLKGDNVLLIFDKDSDFKFKERSSIELRGRSGEGDPFAGFVLATTRTNTDEFEISSSAARVLLGTIYIPNAVLRVEGKDKVADQSAWTVVVARGLKMKGSPSLVINSNYAGTTVKPPDGVGPTSNDVRLIK
ncbi:MAG TPA: TadE/TadG family type IV pilus assembly protein [Phenylobacterium sp.]